MNNPGAIYRSRPLSHMIKSATSSRSQSIDPFYYSQENSKAYTDKKKFDEDSIEDNQSIKRRKLFESEHCDYFTKEIELEYVTKEFDIDINNLI
ncbi:unnamed protein product [Rhizophagus irregularis]|nr:unnamed protein product [Rhizophagus irregularis]